MGVASLFPKRLARAGRKPSAPVYLVRPAGRGVRWWLTGPDGTALAAAPHPVATPEQARRDTFSVRLAAATGPVECGTDAAGRIRWSLLSRSGEAVLAVSAASYADRFAAERAVAVFRRDASHAELHD